MGGPWVFAIRVARVICGGTRGPLAGDPPPRGSCKHAHAHSHSQPACDSSSYE